MRRRPTASPPPACPPRPACDPRLGFAAAMTEGSTPGPGPLLSEEHEQVMETARGVLRGDEHGLTGAA